MALPGDYDDGDELLYTGWSFTYPDGARKVYDDKGKATGDRAMVGGHLLYRVMFPGNNGWRLLRSARARCCHCHGWSST